MSVEYILIRNPFSLPARYLTLGARLSTSVWMALTTPNPLKKLPWVAKKEREREERRLKLEGSKLYRELGVSEDATFEDIQEATRKLLLRHEGDLKKKVRIEMTKDKIMQLRLNQRLGGMLKETKEARADSYLKEDADEFDRQGKEWEPPKWTQGLIVKPNEQWRDNCVIFFGSICALGLFLPTAHNGLKFFSFILGAGFMAQRGTPRAEPGMSYMERVGSHTFLAFALAFLTYVVAASLVTAFTRSLPSIADNQIANSIETIVVASAMGLATAFLQPYRKHISKTRRTKKTETEN